MSAWHAVAVTRDIVASVLGATLMVTGVALVALNARSQIAFGEVAAQHGGAIVDLGQGGAVVPRSSGRMVRVTGLPQVVVRPLDREFEQTADTPLLARHVEMFQWREVRVGDSIHYEQDWVDHWEDTRDFREPQGHANPQFFPVANHVFDAGRVTLGRYRLAPALLQALPGTLAVSPDMDALPPNLAASFVRNGDYLQSSRSVDSPQLGDLRIRWDGVPLRPVTVVARLDGDLLAPATDSPDGQGYQVALGDVGVRELFPDLPSPPEAVVPRRVLAFLLAAVGAFLLISVRRRSAVTTTPAASSRRLRGDIALALGLGALGVGAVAAVVWLGHDRQLALAWGGAALAGAIVSTWQWYRTYR